MYTSIQFKMDCFHHFAVLLQHDVPVKDNQLCYTAFSTFGLSVKCLNGINFKMMRKTICSYAGPELLIIQGLSISSCSNLQIHYSEKNLEVKMFILYCKFSSVT